MQGLKRLLEDTNYISGDINTALGTKAAHAHSYEHTEVEQGKGAVNMEERIYMYKQSERKKIARHVLSLLSRAVCV
jgi:hypothetical protein